MQETEKIGVHEPGSRHRTKIRRHGKHRWKRRLITASAVVIVMALVIFLWFWWISAEGRGTP